MKELRAGPGQVTLVDDEDCEWLSQWAWSRTYYKNKHTQYAYKILPRENGKYVGCVYMHRLIMDAQPGQQVDHINGDGMDNRRANLRLCDQSQNNLNSRKRANSSSRFKGVTWRKDTQKWQAQGWWHGKRHSLGSYTSEKDAADAYNQFVQEKTDARYATTNDLQSTSWKD